MHTLDSMQCLNKSSGFDRDKSLTCVYFIIDRRQRLGSVLKNVKCYSNVIA